MFLVSKDNCSFNNNKLWRIFIVLGILITLFCGIWYYNDDNRYVNWDDDTVGWIINEEMVYIYHSYSKTRIKELPDINKLNLDAELIRSIKVLKYFNNLESLVINAKNIKSYQVSS